MWSGAPGRTKGPGPVQRQPDHGQIKYDLNDPPKMVHRSTRIETRGVTHGLPRSKSQTTIETAKAEMSMGDIIENAIMVNRLSPRKGALETQVFVGAIRDGEDTLIARVLVDKMESGQLTASPEDLEVIYKLNSAKAKKIAEPVDRGGIESLPTSASAIEVSVHDLLDAVKLERPAKNGASFNWRVFDNGVEIK